MPYNLSIKKKQKYIHIDLYDEFTQSDIDNAMKEVLAISQEQNLKHILCDQRQLKVPPNDTVGFMTALQFTSKPYKGMKLAILRRNIVEEHLFDIAAHNRAVIFGVFTDEEEAKQWLHNE